MIHTIRSVAVGDQESKIDSPIILYRGDREVEVEFTINGSKFTFTNGGNVIKSTNATHGQLVINTPTGENMFSEVTECHDGKVVFVITKEMIDELIEVGFYSFQIRLFDESQVSRVTIPPVLKGIDIRNPIAAEDETNVVDIGLVDYAVVVKDEFEDLSTFLPNGNYNKTEWESKDVISGAKLNKIEDALYNINSNMEATDLALLNRVENINKTIHGEIDKLGNELESEVEQFKIDTNMAMTNHKNEVSEELESVNSQLDNMKYYVTPEMFGAKGDGVTDDSVAIQKAIDFLASGGVVKFLPKTYLVNTQFNINKPGIMLRGSKISREGFGTRIITNLDLDEPLVEVKYKDSNNMLIGGCIEDIAFLGNNTRQNMEGAKNRDCILIKNVTEFNINNVYISGFKKSAIKAIDWWDSVVIGLEIRACGTPTTTDTNVDGYPALLLDSDDDSTNSIHFFGLHIEECPYQLKIDGLTSHCHFVGSKFECGKLGTTATKNLIFIYEGAYSNTFSACFFACSQDFYMINVRNNKTIFEACQFSAPNENGIRPLINSSNNTSYGKGITINSCIFDGLSKINTPIFLNTNANFTNNMITFKEESGEIKSIVFNKNNVIVGNTITNNHTNGSIFELKGANNKISSNNYNDNVKVFELTSTSNTLDTKHDRFSTVTSINLDFTKSYVGNILWNGNTTTIDKTNLLNPFNGCTFKIIANNGNLTLAKSMLQNSGGNVTIPSGGVIVLVYNSTLSNWFIESKSW